MTPEELASAFGLDASALEPVPVSHQCPACQHPTMPGPGGHRRLCLPCSWRDIGMTEKDNAARIEFAMTVAAYWRKVETYGAVWSNPRAWTTARSRAKKRR